MLFIQIEKKIEIKGIMFFLQAVVYNFLFWILFHVDESIQTSKAKLKTVKTNESKMNETQKFKERKGYLNILKQTGTTLKR